MAQDEKTNGSQEKNLLRFTFVSMLFALAISQIAISAVTWINVLRVPNPEYSAMPALSHLLLALTVVTTSWFGWAISTINKGDVITDPFKRGYYLLLIDVLLVIIYFYLPESAEIDDKKMVFTVASYAEECWAVLLIFGLYIVWDVLNIALPGAGSGSHQKIRKAVASTSPAIICFVFVGIIFYVASTAQSMNQDLLVVLLDVGLVVVVFLFRGLKFIQIPIGKTFGVHESWTRDRPSSYVLISVLLVSCYALIVMGILVLNHWGMNSN